MNPEQKPFASHYIGILGTHHWGMAFPEVVKTTSGAVNPFPRLMFSEALAAFVLAPKQ